MDNYSRKAQIAPMLLIAIAAGVLLLLFGIGILVSTKIRFLAIGITVMVMTFIYVLPAALNGQFTKNKRNFIIILFLIGAGFIAVPYLNFLPQTALSGAVFIPQYGSMECSYVDGNYNLYEKTAVKDSLTITCGSGMNAYTNFCKYQINQHGLSLLDVKACNSAGDCKDISGIQTISSYSDVYSVNLDVNGDGYIDTKDSGAYSILKITRKLGFLGGNYDIRVLGNAYFLKDTQGNGFGTDYPEGCNLLDINPQSHVIKQDFSKFNYQQSANQVPFGKRIFYVWGMTQALTSNIIMHDGKQVYIEKSGYYNNILTSTDGFKYADIQNPVADNSIQCVPSNIFVCNADATLRPTPSQDTTGQSCDLLRGVATNTFYANSVDNKVCYYKCTNNKVEAYNCQVKATCGNGEQYDGANNRCVKVGATGTGFTDAGDSAINTQSECVAQAAKYPYLGYTWVTTTTQPTVWQEIISFGTAKPVTSGYCSAKNMPYYIYSIVAIVIIIILVILLKTPKNKRKK